MLSRHGQKILILSVLLGLLSCLSLFFDHEKAFWSEQETPSRTPLTDRVVAASDRPSEDVPVVTASPSAKTPSDRPVPGDTRLERSALFPNAHWKVVPGMTAFSPMGMSQLGLSKQRAKAQVSGFYLFAGSEFESQERAFIVGQPLVMKNERTGDLGVVTGSLQIVLKDNGVLEVLLRSYQLKVLDAFPHLRSYVVTSQTSPFDLLDLTQRLSRDSEIVGVEPEILTRDFKSNRGRR